MATQQQPQSKTAGAVGQIEAFAGTVMAALLAVTVCLFGGFLCAAPAYREIARQFSMNAWVIAAAGDPPLTVVLDDRPVIRHKDFLVTDSS